MFQMYCCTSWEFNYQIRQDSNDTLRFSLDILYKYNTLQIAKGWLAVL